MWRFGDGRANGRQLKLWIGLYWLPDCQPENIGIHDELKRRLLSRKNKLVGCTVLSHGNRILEKNAIKWNLSSWVRLGSECLWIFFYFKGKVQNDVFHENVWDKSPSLHRIVSDINMISFWYIYTDDCIKPAFYPRFQGHQGHQPIICSYWKTGKFGL